MELRLRWTSFDVNGNAKEDALTALKEQVDASSLLGVWQSVLGDTSRVYVLEKLSEDAPDITAPGDILEGTGLFSAAPYCSAIESDHGVPLSCLPEVTTGEFGPFYEIRSYELYPHLALARAQEAWKKHITTRLAIAPIAAVFHTTSGLSPRLIHIYPYKSLLERLQVRERAIATGLWPPKGGAARNRLMKSEMTVAADFSPLR